MKLLEIIKRVARTLSKEDCQYCLIGGHAASLYRSEERFTKDVDFAIVANPKSASAKLAKDAIKKLGLKPIAAFITKSEKERPRKSICLITSEPRRGESSGLVDFLLPELPWIVSAVERAQYNLVDLGFAKVPVITAEDLIIAKCYALQNAPDRFQDLDDLKHIFEYMSNLDLDYVREKMLEYGTSAPIQALKYFKKKTPT